MTAKTLQLLLVEDNPAHAELIRRAFLSYDRQVELTVARTLQEARATLVTVQPDLAIIDLLLPDGRGLELLPGDESAAYYPSVMMTSHGNRSEEHTSELQSLRHLVCRLLLEKKK